MKVIYVNDCAYTSETIAKYLDKTQFQIEFIKRTRGLWDKTMGIFFKISNAYADLYHIAYCLQDAFFTLKLKKKQPVIVHVHGSDIRKTLNSRKWGWIVKSNLKNATVVFVSPPDLLEKVYEYTEHVAYIPNPIDLSLFTPQPPKNNDKITIFHPYLTKSRGTNILLSAFRMLEFKFPDKYELMLFQKIDMDDNFRASLFRLRNVKWIEPVKHDEMPNIYGMADVVVSDLKIGVLSNCSLEAMACEKTIIQYVNEDVYNTNSIPPVISLGKEQLTPKDLFDSILSYSEVGKLEKNGRDYVLQNHDAKKIAEDVSEVYKDLIWANIK